MLPNNQWASQAIVEDIIAPRDKAKVNPTTSSDNGPIAIQNTSKGLMAKIWTASYNSVTGSVTLQDGTNLFTDVNLKELSLTFNQTGNPFVAFRSTTRIKIWWYDTLLSNYTIKDVTAGDQPFCYLDERRPEFSANSDVFLLYHRDGEIFYRLQRDRFDVEYSTGIIGGTDIVIECFGMAKNNRLQIKYYEGS